MPVYTCELCQKEFNQKGDLTKHKAKKTPCITMEQIQGLTNANEETNDIKELLKRTFKQCLDILRSEGLTCDKALRNLSYILILKLIEPQFRTTIDIQNFPYVYSGKTPQSKEHNKAILMKIVYFSELVQEEQDNLALRLSVLWTDVLSQHPSTKDIFLKGKTFDMKRGSTFKRLIDAVNSIPETTSDILGDAYEDLINDIMTKGKGLGQFFTAPRIKKIMIKLVNPQLHPDGTIETCCDPTMGTGGFLISYLRDILAQSKSKQIKLDWDFIKSKGLYGKELEPDTYQLAMSNMLLSSGHLFEELYQGDSLQEPIDRKFDVILSNPPFGIKGLNYDEYTKLKDVYMPIKTDNAVSLFLQAIVYMLKVGGRCAVVLPDGQDLFSKAKGYSIIREYLMKTCDLKEILYLPSGIFEYTSIKTCIFFFVKKCEGAEALTVVTKTSASKKVTKDYTFDKKHHTKTVKFYDYNPYEEIKNLLVEVSIETIAAKAYSLNYAEYLEEEVEEYEEGVVVKTLGEVCKFLSKSKRPASYGEKEGSYPFFKSSRKVDCYVDVPDYEEESLIIGDGGEPNINYGVKFSTSDHCYILQNMTDGIVNLKYIYYYLYNNLDMMSQYYTGVGIKNISKKSIEGIKIPIPSLERQKEFVDDLDFISETNKASTSKIADLKRLNEFCLRQQKRFGENEMKTLGEISEFIKTGKNKPADNKTGTLYPYYGTGSITGYTDEYLYDGTYILTARNGTIGNCFLTQGRFFPSDHIFIIDIKDKCTMKYIYYILSNNEQLDKMKTGIGIQNITKGILENFKIPLPSLERQQEIVDYCDKNHALIQQLEQEIERNQEMAKHFMSGLSKH